MFVYHRTNMEYKAVRYLYKTESESFMFNISLKERNKGLNLGVTFTSTFKFDKQVSTVVKSCFFFLNKIIGQNQVIFIF